MKKCTVRLTFLDKVLGTKTVDEEDYIKYMCSQTSLTKEKIKSELLSLSEEAREMQEETGRPFTTFFRLTLKDGTKVPAMDGNMLKGFFKNACSALRDCEGTLSADLTAYKKKIDNEVFVNMNTPGRDDKSQIVLSDPSCYKDGVLPICRRPLRGSTAQGERVAIAASEAAPAGSYIDFEICVFNDKYWAHIFEWLDYGQYNGLGCWHNSGKGRFKYEILDGDERPDADGSGSKPAKRGRKKKVDVEA